MTPSQYSNTEGIDGEIQLADSGYGQGQILVNPLHLASLYTAFFKPGERDQTLPFIQRKPGTLCVAAAGLFPECGGNHPAGDDPGDQ